MDPRLQDAEDIRTHGRLQDKPKYLSSEQEGITCVWCNSVNSPAESYYNNCKRPLSNEILHKRTELERIVEELIERKLNTLF